MAERILDVKNLKKIYGGMGRVKTMPAKLKPSAM